MGDSGSNGANGAGKFKWIGTRPVRPDGVDKVTGRAAFGADFFLPGMLFGRVLRSPHAHARIKRIDTSKAEALAGVKAVVTSADFPDIPSEEAFVGEGPMNFRDLSHNCLARDKVLYDGHAVAAVAATSQSIAEAALDLIEVDYEVLPHVIDVMEAIKPDAPLLHPDLVTSGAGVEPGGKPSNIAKRFETGRGDLDAGFADADVVLEREYTTKPVHQGYIEPHACVVSYSEDGQTTIWSSSQGQFMVRAYTAKLLGMELSSIRAIPAEIGGGFGGKTLVYLEPVAVALSRKSHRPVKMTMTRDEVFRASGPTSGTWMRVKIGVKKDGTITAADAELYYQAGAYSASPAGPASMTGFACYHLDNVRVVAYDVVVNRPRCAAYRAPGAPMVAFAVESLLDEVADAIDLDPVEFRLKNAAKSNTQSSYGPQFQTIGYVETLEAVKNHPHYQAPLGPNQGRGVASGFWFNIGGESSASINIGEDGTVVVVSGNPDIGGSRASMAIMAAEELGVDIHQVKAIVGDTHSIPYSFLTGGSRVTYATGMAVVESARDVKRQLCARAAMIWDIEPDAVEWVDGEARPAGDNAGKFEPLSLADIAGMSAKTGGPIGKSTSINAQGAGPGFGTHLVDVEVDRETGHVKILRYTAAQDAGRAIHMDYVEGQVQGGVAQGIGWALNEEYIYGDDGRLQNAGFLDYRMPVASDLPMIDTLIVEVPNPEHPYGVRGVGEVPIVPPMAAVANAIEAATGKRMPDLPISPPRLLAALGE